MLNFFFPSLELCSHSGVRQMLKRLSKILSCYYRDECDISINIEYNRPAISHDESYQNSLNEEY